MKNLSISDNCLYSKYLKGSVRAKNPICTHKSLVLLKRLSSRIDSHEVEDFTSDDISDFCSKGINDKVCLPAKKLKDSF